MVLLVHPCQIRSLSQSWQQSASVLDQEPFSIMVLLVHPCWIRRSLSQSWQQKCICAGSGTFLSGATETVPWQIATLRPTYITHPVYHCGRYAAFGIKTVPWWIGTQIASYILIEVGDSFSACLLACLFACLLFHSKFNHSQGMLAVCGVPKVVKTMPAWFCSMVLKHSPPHVLAVL